MQKMESLILHELTSQTWNRNTLKSRIQDRKHPQKTVKEVQIL